MDGVVTTAPALGRAAFDGTTGPQSLECTANGVPATSFAGLCVLGLLDLPLNEPSQGLSVLPLSDISGGTIGVILALIVITFFNVLTVRWARQSRQKALPPELRDPVWSPYIYAAVSKFVYDRWKWVNRVDEITFVIVTNLVAKASRFVRGALQAITNWARLCGKTVVLARFVFVRMLRRSRRNLRFAIDSRKLNWQLRSRRKLRVELEPLETLGERAVKARDRRLRTLRRTSEDAKWLPAFITGTAHVEALELIMLCQNKLKLSSEQFDLATSHIWTIDVRRSVAHLGAARNALNQVLYAAKVVEEASPAVNGPINEVLKDLDEEVAEQLERSPTFADLNVQGVVQFPEVRGKGGKRTKGAEDGSRPSPDTFKLLTILEEYTEINAIRVRLVELVRVNEVNAMLKEMEELVAKPFDPLQLDSHSVRLAFVDALRIDELEPFIPFSTNFLSERKALTMADGSARPQMLALKQRTVDAMMLATAHQAAEELLDGSGEALGVEGLLSFRSEKLEPRELMAEVYLIEHDAASYLSPARKAAGASQPEILSIKARIVEITLLAIDKTVASPIEVLSREELLAHRTNVLEPMQADATAYLRARGELELRNGGDHGSVVRPQMVALEERIVQTTLLMVRRVIALEIVQLDIDELFMLRTNEQLPMQSAATSFLEARGGLLGKDGRTHSALIALEARIVETTLLAVTVQLAKPISQLEIPQLRAFMHEELEPMETAVTAFLRDRNALKRTGDNAPHQELLDLSDRIVECSLSMASRVLAMPYDHMSTVDELQAFRDDVIDPMLKEVTEHLKARDGTRRPSKDGGGQETHPELVALRERSITLTLAMVSIVVAKPLDQLSEAELLLLRQSELEPMKPSATDYLTFREALMINGEQRTELIELEDRIVQVTLTMINNLLAEPIDKMGVDELRDFRTRRLEKMQHEAVAHLKGRNALLAKDGTERPELIALEDRIIACTLLMVTRVVDIPIHKLSVDEMREHRRKILEPMEPEATDYLRSRDALKSKDGQARQEIVALADRIVETTLLMVSTRADIPIDKLGVDELRELRTSKLEPILPEASEFLKLRNALSVAGPDGTLYTQPKITALSNRIIECTLTMIARVVAIPIDVMAIPELLAHRSAPLESIEAETLDFLRKHNALLGPDGLTQPEVVQLADRIVETTLFQLTILMQKPLEQLDIPQLEALRDDELQPALPAAKGYLERRNALVDRSGVPHPHLAHLEEHIIRVTLTTVERVLAVPMDGMSIGELEAFRRNQLEVRQVKAEAHLKSRGAALSKDGTPHKQMADLEAKIVDCTLYAPSNLHAATHWTAHALTCRRLDCFLSLSIDDPLSRFPRAGSSSSELSRSQWMVYQYPIFARCAIVSLNLWARQPLRTSQSGRRCWIKTARRARSSSSWKSASSKRPCSW